MLESKRIMVPSETNKNIDWQSFYAVEYVYKVNFIDEQSEYQKLYPKQISYY